MSKQKKGSQMQQSLDEQAQFNMQMQFNLVIQQLERLERVESGVQREGAMKRNREGDINHKSIKENLAALNTKLMCLSGSNKFYQNSFSEACTRQLLDWCKRRETYSSNMLEALQKTLDACEGNFSFTPTQVSLSKHQLALYAEKLATATSHFHDEEEEAKDDPQKFIVSQQYPVEPHFKPPRSAESASEEMHELLRRYSLQTDFTDQDAAE